MLPYLIAGAIGFVVGKLLEEDEAPKYADGGEINYGSPKVNMSDIPFIHETTKEIADKILKEGFIVSKNDNITKGVYTIPIVYKKESFNSQEIELEVFLKPNSKIFWTNTKRPMDFYYGVGNNFFNALFIKLGGNQRDNNRIVFLRNMEKWLSNNGYCGIQQGGEIVITDLSCIESIQQFERHNTDIHIRYKAGGKVDENELKMSEMNIALNTKTGQVYVGGIKPKNRVFKDEKGYYLVEGYGKFMGKKYPIKKHFTPSENEVLDAYMQDKYAKGGEVKTEFDKGMVLNNLDMIKEYSVAIDKMVTENTKLDEWIKMKLTKVEQNMADIKHAIEGFDKYGEGGRIFKKQLLHISKYATDIKKMVSGKKEVMSWIEGKLFVSADYMDTLYHFLDYESGNTASKYKKGGKVGAEYVVYDWDTYEKLSTHKTIESAKKNMYELYKDKRNLHLAIKNRAEFEETKEMLLMKDGGSIEESSKVGLHLPMEISVYVPSTKDANIPVSKAELNARVKEVKQYLATLFGGYSSSEILGGYVSTTGELIQEDVVKVISFATKQAYKENEATLIDKIADWSKEWSQEAIGLEIEGDLYYINQTQETFRNGGGLGGFEYTIGGL